jgi:hypothetical protein
MQKAAVEKATDRVASAKARLKDLESSKSYEASRRHWYDFLVSSNSVFSILEQGAKGHNQSENWFGKRRRQRKNDRLLCYLHHARNAEEHNIPSVTEMDRQKIVMVADGKPVAAVENMVGKSGTYRQLTEQAPELQKITEMRIYPERAKLIDVRDRGVDYATPVEHLGAVIEDNTPIEVARLMVQYIEKMTDEARSLIAG